MKKEFNCKKSRIHKCAAFALAMVLSVTSILFTTYQNLTIKELSAAINRTQESINNTTALVPDTSEESFSIDAGNSILALNQISVPEEIELAETTSEICNTEIEKDVEDYRFRQMIAAAQYKAASTPGMVGTLIIPAVGINVPLFNVNIRSEGSARAQVVTDNANSCAYMPDYIPGAALLADHQHQDFRTLDQVRIGTTGYIVTADSVINIVATTVMNGHNTGEIVDSNMSPVGAIAPYIAYTCQGSSYNIRIVGFSIK